MQRLDVTIRAVMGPGPRFLFGKKYKLLSFFFSICLQTFFQQTHSSRYYLLFDCGIETCRTTPKWLVVLFLKVSSYLVLWTLPKNLCGVDRFAYINSCRRNIFGGSR